MSTGAYLGLEKCAPEDTDTASLVGRFVGASLRIEDVDSAYASLCAKGVAFTAPPQKQPWGGTLAHFLDPDRNVLTLLSGDF